jgi:hypothetical protein
VVLENEDHHAERQRGGHMSEPFAGPRRAWAWERWLPLAGAGAVVLWVIGFIVQGESPDPFEASAREWVTYVSDNDGQILASRLLTLFGVLLFLWFLGTLRTALRAAEGEPGPWAAIAFGSGIALAVLLFAATTALLAAAATSGAVEAGAAQALAVSEIGFFFAAEVAAASLLIATGLLALRTGVLPVWLGWASLVIALLLLIVDTPIGFIAFLLGFQLWVIIVSILLSLRSPEAAA